VWAIVVASSSSNGCVGCSSYDRYDVSVTQLQLITSKWQETAGKKPTLGYDTASGLGNIASVCTSREPISLLQQSIRVGLPETVVIIRIIWLVDDARVVSEPPSPKDRFKVPLRVRTWFTPFFIFFSKFSQTCFLSTQELRLCEFTKKNLLTRRNISLP